MTITPEKIIESKIELTNDEYDILVDYKILMEKIRHGMTVKEIDQAAGLTYAYISSEIASVQKIMEKVSLLPEV